MLAQVILWRVSVSSVIIYLGLFSACAQSSVLIDVPNNRAQIEGNSQDSTPFEVPSRFQQVYDASQFSAISNGGGGLITRVVFRIDRRCDPNGFGITISNFQINLSTTSKTPDGLSAVFADNIGNDDVVVFGPQLVVLGQECSLGTSPQGFGTGIRFSNPFYYNPALGNLLMDLRNFSGASGDSGALDAEFTKGDSVSCVLDTVATATTARFVASYGFVTRFDIQPVPRLSLSVLWPNLLFRWENQVGGWTLQQTSVIGPDSNWQPAGGVVSTNGGNQEVTLPLDAHTSARFFRLVQSSGAFGAASAPTNPKPAVILIEDP